MPSRLQRLRLSRTSRERPTGHSFGDRRMRNNRRMDARSAMLDAVLAAVRGNGEELSRRLAPDSSFVDLLDDSPDVVGHEIVEALSGGGGLFESRRVEEVDSRRVVGPMAISTITVVDQIGSVEIEDVGAVQPEALRVRSCLIVASDDNEHIDHIVLVGVAADR